MQRKDILAKAENLIQKVKLRELSGARDMVIESLKARKRFIKQKMARKAILDDAMGYLRDIPEMQDILANLPDNLKIRFSTCTKRAKYSPKDNKIIINAKKYDYYDPQGKFYFLTYLAHELCHASQKKSGLNIDDIINPSVGGTFRISKMAEMETRLLDVVIQERLLEKEELYKCSAFTAVFLWRYMLAQAKGDERKAKRDFILAYWKNEFDDKELNLRSPAFSRLPNEDVNVEYISGIFKTSVNEWNNTYTKQASRDLYIIHKAKRPSTNRTTPIQAIQTYLQRMGVDGMIDPELFLQNRFDNAEVSDKLSDGVTVFNSDGTKRCKYISNKFGRIELVYFKGNMPQNSNSFISNAKDSGR